MTESAIDSVQRSMNEAFAELDLALIDETSASSKRKKVEILSSAQINNADGTNNAKQLVEGENNDTIDLRLTDILPADVIPARR